MLNIALIAAMAENGVIGRDNQMPWHLPADLAYFKKVTLGKRVVMGRKTFDSIGRPLPDRRNLVISRNPAFQPDGVEVFGSVEETLAALVADGSDDEIMVIGGGTIYQRMMVHADRLYLTRIDLAVEGDAYFPELDSKEWCLQSSSACQADERNPYDHRFEVWERY